MAASLARLATTATRYLIRSPSTLRPISALSWKTSLGPSLSPSQRLYFYSYSYSTSASAFNNLLADSTPLHEAEPVSEDSASDQTKNFASLDPVALPFFSLESSIHPNTYRALTSEPFKLDTMSHVQSKVLPLLPKLALPYVLHDSEQQVPFARDLLVKAKTGTGKTLAFLVPALEARLKTIEHHVQTCVNNAGMADHPTQMRARRAFAQKHVGTLVISPTRELATQIANEALRLMTHHQGFQVQLLVGGESRRGQIRDWEKGRKDLVVATPGRLRDLVQSEREFADALKHTQLVGAFFFLSVLRCMD